MKIIGGSFGLSGDVYLTEDQQLAICAQTNKSYRRDQIQHINTQTQSEKKFGVFSFIIGAIILVILLGMFFNIIGAIIGIAIAAAGSFYTKTSHHATVQLNDGKTVTIACSKSEAKELIAFAHA